MDSVMNSVTSQSTKPAILVVEDDPAVALTVVTLLEAEGYPVRQAASSGEGLELLSASHFPIVISDIYLDHKTGLDILHHARSLNPQCAVILMTGQGSLETVLEATRAGAFDYLAKPFPLDKLLAIVRNAEQLLRQSISAPGNDASPPGTVLVGNSPAIVEVFKFISHVADSDATVLIEGETGTGKELVAKLIHQSGPRRAHRFVVVDCGSLPSSLLETELFGAVRGAYTGADRDRPGLLESADGGTVFFDEIGEIDPAFQLRLLRFLQEREIRPVGSSSSRKVDARVIAASNRDLRNLVADKKFREDLWYRLNVTSVHLSPLRDRTEDIRPLIHHFLESFRNRTGRLMQFTDGALKAAVSYSWPGNVRQLENVLERLSILQRGTLVEEDAFRHALQALDPAKKLQSPEALAQVEEEQIRKVLAATHGNKTRAAEILGIERKTLYRKLEKMP